MNQFNTNAFMKKFFTVMLFFVLSLAARAYTDVLIISVDGDSTTVPSSTILIEKTGDDVYQFVMKDFQMDAIMMGDIIADNIPGTTTDGITTLDVTGVPVTISDPLWAQMLPGLTVNIKAKFNDEKLYAVVDIDLTEQLGQMVVATFGTEEGFETVEDTKPQLLNPGFEDWGIDEEMGIMFPAEPRYWHSFSSATGPFVQFVGNHCFKNEDAHSGQYSVRLISTNIMGLAIANGTISTGRMICGSMTPDEPANHSRLDMSLKDVDRNGDPFYQTFSAHPDSVVFWVKYRSNAEGVRAGMGAYITDGTYCQIPLPHDTVYTNKIGIAEITTIEPCSEWTRFSVPFTYPETDLTPRAMFMTFSTCIIPGEGNGREELCVDDVELIYKDEEESDIFEVRTSANDHSNLNVIYDLQGRRHSTLQRGINIVNGKKVVVK